MLKKIDNVNIAYTIFWIHHGLNKYFQTLKQHSNNAINGLRWVLGDFMAERKG